MNTRAQEQQILRRLRLRGLRAVTGSAAGALYDSLDRVFVRYRTSNGLSLPPSVQGPIPPSVREQIGESVILKWDDRGDLYIDGPDVNAQRAKGGNPNAIRTSGYVAQDAIITGKLQPTNPLSMGVAVQGWRIIVGNTAYQFLGKNSHPLTSLLPTSGYKRFVAVFVKNDYSTVEAFGSTEYPISDVDLGATEVTECLVQRSAGSTLMGVVLLYGQLTIDTPDIQDWRQMINTDTALSAGNVSGPLTSVVDKTLPRWNGTDGKHLQGSNIVVDDSGNMTAVNLNATANDGTTNAVVNVATFTHNTTGTGAAGIGVSATFKTETSTTPDTTVASIKASLPVATHASRTGRLDIEVADSTGSRTVLRLDATGTAGTATIFGTATLSIGSQSGILTHANSTTRTYTLPDLTGTVALLTGAQTFQNKTFDNTNTVTLLDTLFTLQDNVDPTKQAQFQLSGITTGTTRTITLPNRDTGLVILSPSATADNTITATGAAIVPATFNIPSGSTANIANFQANAATLAGVNSLGYIFVGTASTTRALNVQKSLTQPASTTTIINGTGTYTYTSNNSSTGFGVASTLSVFTGGFTLTGTFHGASFILNSSDVGGSISTMNAATYQFTNFNTTNITTVRGMNLTAPSNAGGGTITTYAALDIGAVAVATNNYAIRSAAGLVDFGDRVKAVIADAATATVTNALIIGHNTSGTPAASYGTGLRVQAQDSTTANVDIAAINTYWTTATHASRDSRLDVVVYDAASNYVGLSLGTSGGAAALSVFGGGIVAQQTALGTTAGFTAGVGTPVNDDSTFDGGLGGSAYTLGDVVLALKNYSLLAA